MEDRLSQLLKDVGDVFAMQNIVKSEVVEGGHDIHAFYRLVKDPSKVIHVQGYPGMSTEKNCMVSARLMDYNMMMKIRESGRVSIGNEHTAVIGVFQNFNYGTGIMIPYEKDVLEDLLAENVPELREVKKKSKWED
jgi:hypothetical protein